MKLTRSLLVPNHVVALFSLMEGKTGPVWLDNNFILLPGDDIDHVTLNPALSKWRYFSATRARYD